MTEVAGFACLQVSRSADLLRVEYCPPAGLIQQRKKVANSAARLFRRSLARIGGVAVADGGFELPADRLAQLADIDRRIMAIAAAPLSGRSVERTLAISGDERRRWTRDGRLPTCAKSVAGRSSHLFSLSMYSAELILDLATDPATIAGWRAADERG